MKSIAEGQSKLLYITLRLWPLLTRSDLKFSSSSIANTVHTLPVVPQIFFLVEGSPEAEKAHYHYYCPKWKHDDVANLLYCVSRGEAVNSRLPLEF